MLIHLHSQTFPSLWEIDSKISPQSSSMPQEREERRMVDVNALPVEIIHRIACSLYTNPRFPSTTKPETYTYSTSISYRKKFIENDPFANDSTLLKWSMASKSLWERISCGGICDDVWRMACLRRWKHDGALWHMTATPYDKHDNDGFWRKEYLRRVEWERKATAGVYTYHEDGLQERLSTLISMNTLFSVSRFHSFVSSD